MAAALLPVGLATVIATAKGVGATGAAGAAAEITLGSIATAFTAPTAMVILGAAVLLTAVAIGSCYMASQHYYNAILNSSEMNAQHVAKYTAKELKAQVSCVQSEHPENARADGKQWSQVVQEQSSKLSLTRH
ncbi:MAG: hypothetical protein ABL857_08405 [Rickettsiales bacterium]|jgi:hypothetical protein